MRQQSFIPAWQEHHVEFETLGAVQRHQIDALGTLFAFRVHHQADMLHEAGQSVELIHEADQLFQIFELRLRLRRLLGLPHCGVAGLIEDQLGKLGMAHGVDQSSASGRTLR